MDYFQTVLLALIQGVTEFLPISSSAHLILVPVVTGWPDQGLAFDVAVHAGSLAAVVVYFREELRHMAVAGVRSLAGRHDRESRLAWAVVLGTVPVVGFGLAGKSTIEAALRGPLVIATTAIVFGLLLWWADARARQERDEYSIGWREAVLVGLAQAVALIPGTSRSGITMTAGLMLGLTREASARFSFLLSIPTLLAANVLIGRDLLREPQSVDWGVLALGTVVAGLSAYACIHYFIRLLSRTGMLPYVLYRIALGLLLFWLFW
ncbi:MAG: undecaprenyl-diphosphate phosphatase [Rhodocyclaceae bacterium]|nr:undecaprenyl-diphosphate phosphatase [Rhodocyclaceae bacterium]MCL4758327.1 undecaprenyl-diphosphate phosphatase [Rhodocyclaceae bacterium]